MYDTKKKSCTVLYGTASKLGQTEKPRQQFLKYSPARKIPNSAEDAKFKKCSFTEDI